MDWGEGEVDDAARVDADEHGARRFLHKQTEVRVVVGITCSLSIIGSLFIILSYLCFRDLRSRARLILVFISIMDCGVGLSNLIGAAVYFDRFYTRNTDCIGDVEIHPRHFLYCPPSKTIQALCVAQAFFAQYFTLGSIMCTISLSLYLYFLIVLHGTSRAKKLLIVTLMFSFLVPLLVTTWFLLTGKLGFSPYDSAGWCTDIYNHPESGYRDIFAVAVGYDLWIYLTMILVPILSISVHFYVKEELKNAEPYYNSERYRQALHSVDYKFLLIPVVFLILRIWTCIISILFIYYGLSFREVPKWAGILLIHLSGIGDSGQGLVNAILFVLFTKKVRDKFYWYLSCGRLRLMIKASRYSERQRLLKDRPRPMGVSQSIDVDHTPQHSGTYDALQ